MLICSTKFMTCGYFNIICVLWHSCIINRGDDTTKTVKNGKDVNCDILKRNIDLGLIRFCKHSYCKFRGQNNYLVKIRHCDSPDL